jgi:hypothetical protein
MTREVGIAPKVGTLPGSVEHNAATGRAQPTSRETARLICAAEFSAGHCLAQDFVVDGLEGVVVRLQRRARGQADDQVLYGFEQHEVARLAARWLDL